MEKRAKITLKTNEKVIEYEISIELKNNITINLNTIKYEVSDKKIEIMYKIDENSYEYFIEME